MDRSDLRVLHVLRGDHDRAPGGDIVQLRSSVAGLAARGWDAVAAPLVEADGRFDLVHVYNLQRPRELRRDIEEARRRWPGAALILSPVYWPPAPGSVLRAPDRFVRRRLLRASLAAVGWWPRLRPILAAADAVLPNSSIELRRVSRLYRLPTRRWTVVPNGVDLAAYPYRRQLEWRDELLARWGLDDVGGPVLICVARLEPYKNQLTLLRALDELPGALLLLVGPDGEADYAAAVRGAAAPLRHRVALVGRCDPPAVIDLLAVSDVHVLPSFRETPGLATLEAAAVGCEVVATRYGSTEEYLGDAAAYADPSDPGSVAAGIADVLARPRQPAARARVRRFTWDAAAAVLDGAYRRTAPTAAR